MTQSKPPTRWLEQPEALPPALCAALAAYQDRAPSAAEHDATFAALAARLSAPDARAAPQPQRLRRLWYGAGLAGLAAVVALLLQMRSPAPRRPRAIDAPAAPARVQPAAASEHVETRDAGVRTSGAELDLPTGARASGAELAAPKPASSARAARPTRAPRAAPSAADPRAELLLLTPARRVLPSDPARSLELVAEHARRFAHGVFAEERDLLRIEALLRAGQRAPAAEHARRFRLTYPRSAHLEHLAEALAR